MPRRILLTGATGALGPHVAAELLALPAVDRIHILVRSSSVPARDRFDAWSKTVCALHRAATGQAVDRARLHLVEGDVAEPGLGLQPRQCQELARQTDIILHAAADTRFLGPADVQQDINVEGTRRLLEWAGQCPSLQQFILVSTICVAGSSTGRVPEASFVPPGFVNRYEKTKWEAEQLVLASPLPVRSARVSIVTGSHATGAVHRLGALHHVLRWFGRGLIPMVPGTPTTLVDLIAVETAARLLARAAVADTPDKAIWHIAAGERAIPLHDLMEFVWQEFAAEREAAQSRRTTMPRIVDAAAFEALRQRIGDRDPVQAHLIKSIDSSLPGLLYPRVFDTTAAETLWGGPLPLPDWRQTLRRVIRFITQGTGATGGRAARRAAVHHEFAEPVGR